MAPTPLLLVGDGPQEPTGVGRILRDLGVQIAASDLPVDLASAGGPALPRWEAWPAYPMGEVDRADDWGARYVEAVYRDRFGDRPGVLWLTWDPSRLAAYQEVDLPVQRWAYAAIDAPNRRGGVGGPGGEALARFDRVIAYGRWASRIVKARRPDGPVSYLPHGLALETYAPASEAERTGVRAEFGPHCRQRDLVVGCVASNQPRKDLGLFFETLALLGSRGRPVYGWLHTDTLVKAWSVQQLVEDCQLAKRVTVSMASYTDRQIACLYQQCAVTIAPGLGEGFGYPIVESLASGVPVVHGDSGGGAELVPKTEWRVPRRAERLEGVYAQVRPVFEPEDVANAVERALEWKAAVGERVVSEYCRGAVAHLTWPALWPRWRSWIGAGL